MEYMDRIIAYEMGELDEVEIVHLFAELIRTGMVWQLQGSYGRTAARAIEAGIISTSGRVLVETYTRGDTA